MFPKVNFWHQTHVCQVQEVTKNCRNILQFEDEVGEFNLAFFESSDENHDSDSDGSVFEPWKLISNF